MNGKTFHPYSTYCGGLLKMLKSMRPSFVTWSHGDCHSRNVMINLDTRDLRFIDIDKLTDNGDYIYDIGALIADLQVYHALLCSRRPAFEMKQISDREFSYVLQPNKKAYSAVETLMKWAEKISDQYSDGTFMQRLALAKARYLLHMAPKTRDIEKAFTAYFEGLRALETLTGEPSL